MKRLCVFILAAVMGATFLTATTGCPSGDKKTDAAKDKDKDKTTTTTTVDKDKDKK